MRVEGGMTDEAMFNSFKFAYLRYLIDVLKFFDEYIEICGKMLWLQYKNLWGWCRISNAKHCKGL